MIRPVSFDRGPANPHIGSKEYSLRLVPTGGGTAPLSARHRRETGGREREGGIHPVGRERTLSSRSRPCWQARGGGRRAGAKRRASVSVHGRQGWGGSDVARFDWSTQRRKESEIIKSGKEKLTWRRDK
jgi:hypothetical protein